MASCGAWIENFVSGILCDVFEIVTGAEDTLAIDNINNLADTLFNHDWRTIFLPTSDRDGPNEHLMQFVARNVGGGNGCCHSDLAPRNRFPVMILQ